MASFRPAIWSLALMSSSVRPSRIRWLRAVRGWACPFLLERQMLDLELAQAAFWTSISYGMLSTSMRRRDVASSIGRSPCPEESGRNVAVAQGGRGHQRGVLNAHRGALRTSLDPAQDGNRAFHVGSPTSTGWNRRSSAASFSMCLRTRRGWWRRCNGVRRGRGRVSACSRRPQRPRRLRPTSVCNSSMNNTISPSRSSTSRSTAFMRSSNSPLAPRSGRRGPGRRPVCLEILGDVVKPRCAAPGPRRWPFCPPGSPISTGLFLVRRDKTE